MAARVDIKLLCVSSEQKAKAKGVTFVRVVVKGLGPGRLVSQKIKFLLWHFCPCDGIKVHI